MDSGDVLYAPEKPLQIVDSKETDDECSGSISSIGGDIIPMLDLGWSQKTSNSSLFAEAHFKDSSPDLTSFLKGALMSKKSDSYSLSGSSREYSSSPEPKSSYTPSISEYCGYSTPTSTSTGSAFSNGNHMSNSDRPLRSIWNDKPTSIWNENPRTDSPIMSSKNPVRPLDYIWNEKSTSIWNEYPRNESPIVSSKASFWNAQPSGSLRNTPDSSNHDSYNNIQTTLGDLRSSYKAKEDSATKKFKSTSEKRIEEEERLGKRGARILAGMQSRRLDRIWRSPLPLEDNDNSPSNQTDASPNEIPRKQQPEIFDAKSRRSFNPLAPIEKDCETRGRALNYKSCGGYAGSIERKIIGKAWQSRKGLNLRYTRCNWKGKLDIDTNHAVACKKTRQHHNPDPNQDLIAPTLINFTAAQKESSDHDLRLACSSFFSDARTAFPSHSWTLKSELKHPVTPKKVTAEANGVVTSSKPNLTNSSDLTSNINPKCILNEIVQNIWKRYPSEIIRYYTANVGCSNMQWVCHVRLEPLAKTFKGDVCFSKKDAQASAASKCIAFMISQKSWSTWLKESIFEKIVASGCLQEHADNPSRKSDIENNQSRRKRPKDHIMSSRSEDLKNEFSILAMKKRKVNNGLRPPAPFMNTVLVTPPKKSCASDRNRSKKMSDLDASKKALKYTREMRCDIPTGLSGTGTTPWSLSASSRFNSKPSSTSDHTSHKDKKTVDKENTQPIGKSINSRFPSRSSARFGKPNRCNSRFPHSALRKQNRWSINNER